MHYLYILLCKDDTLYTGVTNNLKRRFLQHKNKRGGRYTSIHGAVKILYKEGYLIRKGALKREKQIKSWRREKKIRLTKTAYNMKNETLKYIP